MRALQVGDLVYIPGHVMMVIGRIGGEPYVIHDTTGITYRDADGNAPRAPQRRLGHAAPAADVRQDSRLRRPHHQHPAHSPMTPLTDERMKITDIRFGMLRVPLKTPFKTALRTVDTVEDIVVMCTPTPATSATARRRRPR